MTQTLCNYLNLTGKSFLFSLILCFIVGLNSCVTETPPKTVVKVKEIKNINFFLETSASMGGYIKGSTQFDNIIPKLLIEIENKTTFQAKAVHINYISSSITPYTKTTKEFIYDISTVNVDTGKSSQMADIFEAVTNKTDSTDISIFVSDCILSYPDEAIRKNREVNREKTGELKAFIEQAFLKMKKKNICASLYAFNSRFNGTYYDYQNNKIPVTGDVLRPFYIWVIGNKSLLERFNNQLDSIEDFKPEMTIDFGLFQKPINQYNLLFKTERSGEWSYDENNLIDVETSKNNPLKFAIAVDLSGLPDYAKDASYLKNNLALISNNLKCSLTAIKKVSEIDMQNAAPKERQLLQNATHVIVLTVPEMYGQQGGILLKLPLKYDTEYANWSIADDRDKSILARKTFAFKDLVEGVRDAYQNNNENFIQLNIILKK